jgi:hypothetical protein
MVVCFLGTQLPARHCFGRRRFSQINVPDHDTDLRRAAELVAEAQRFVHAQKGKIIRLKTAGIDTADAERTLGMFETNLKTFEEHRNALQSARQ